MSEQQDFLIDIFTKLNEKKTKLFVAKTKNEELTKRLHDLKNELLSAKEEFIKVNKDANLTFDLYLLQHVKAMKSKELKRKKNEIIELFRKSNEDYVPQQKKCVREAQSMMKSFLKDSSSAPWIPEKKQLLKLLEKESIDLENIQKEIQLMNEKIQERNEIIELHKRYPFHIFCINIITYQRKSIALKKLLIRELKLNYEMKSKVPDKNMSVDESQEFSQSQVPTDTQFQILANNLNERNNLELDKSVPENNEQIETNLLTPQPINSNGSSMIDLTSPNKDANELFLYNNIYETHKSKVTEKNITIDESCDISHPEMQLQLSQQSDENLEKSVLENEEAVIFSTPIVPNVTLFNNSNSLNTSNAITSSAKKKNNETTPFFKLNAFGDESNVEVKKKPKVSDNQIEELNDLEKSTAGAGDFMSMSMSILQMVNESQNISNNVSGGFFDFFGNTGNEKKSNENNNERDSQDSAVGLFNFDFGNSSPEAVNNNASKKSFFDF